MINVHFVVGLPQKKCIFCIRLLAARPAGNPENLSLFLFENSSNTLWRVFLYLGFYKTRYAKAKEEKYKYLEWILNNDQRALCCPIASEEVYLFISDYE